MKELIIPIILQVVLIFLNAVFACAEIAVLSVGEAKLEALSEQGDRRARRLFRLTENPARFLATIQVAITLSGFLGSAFAAENFSDPLVGALMAAGVPLSARTLDSICVVLITLVLSYLTLVFGELVPKRLAMKKAEGVALGISGAVSFISAVFAPIVWFLTVSCNIVLRLMGIDPDAAEDDVSEEDIRLMVDKIEEDILDDEEKEMIHNLFEFDDLAVGEFATHRKEIAVLWADEDVSAWEETVNSTRHTMYLVCGQSADDVVGVFDSRDYFRLADKSKESVMANAVKEAYFVPESVKADVLFKSMRKDGMRMAVVLDEYGGMVGIVTMNDLIGQLLGDFDEVGEEPAVPDILDLGDGVWQVRGTARLDELAEEMKADLPTDEYDTFGGYVFAMHGSVPDDGEQPVFDCDGIEIRVEEIKEHKLERAIVIRREDEEDDD